MTYIPETPAERKLVVQLIKECFEHSFVPQTNRERALGAMIDDLKERLRKMHQIALKYPEDTWFSSEIEEWQNSMEALLR
jgi:hypothetical protein